MKFSELEIVGGIILVIILTGFILNYTWASPQNNSFCGDGVCSDNEKTSCQLDCDWCGDSYCQSNEDCSSCQNDCGSCKADSFCGDGVCNSGECTSGCNKDCSFSQCQNDKCELESGENCYSSPIDCKCLSGEKCDGTLKKCVKISCGDGICSLGETYITCPNDCKQTSFQGETVDSNTNYPIIFVHGHSFQTEDVSTFSINAFDEFQTKLDSDNLYLDKGVIYPNDNINSYFYGEWGRLAKPVSIRTTYYVGTLDSSGAIIQSIESSRSIEEYGERLGKVVDTVLHHTGKNKVIIIAHSMGGLVARSYIKNSQGNNKVYQLIEIGSPNHGIYGGLISVSTLCESVAGVITLHAGQECDDMQHDSSFIASLNSGDETPGNTKYMTIAGSCDNNGEDYHDEVIRVGSVNLEGAINKVINRNGCISGADTYHGYLVSPSKVPEVYTYVKDFLKN